MSASARNHATASEFDKLKGIVVREEFLEHPMSEDTQQAVVLIHRQDGGRIQLRHSFQNE
ncbi:hypothetical protein CVE36_27325 [Pseudomonas syringae pv. actinidiae]|nr:hypothetical protein [Pseudomonas syringae pv. actinidiae]